MEIPHLLAQAEVPNALDSIAIFINAVPVETLAAQHAALTQLQTSPFSCLPKSLCSYRATQVGT